jgi:hypothetical protein
VGIATGAAAAAAAQGRLHTLIYLEGRYTGSLSLTKTAAGMLQPPVIVTFPAALQLQSQGEALVMAWAIGGERKRAAIVGTIGPSAYDVPATFEDLDWDCRPAAIPPFRVDARKIALELVCFTPGELTLPAVARVELTSHLDAARRPTGALDFKVEELSSVQQRAVVTRAFGGTLRRRTD